MEHAIDRREHAHWLENLVLVLNALTQRHRGVFDKFTGDGVLAHFPVYAFERDNKDAATTAMCNCLACAWDMVRAETVCEELMMPNITLKDEKFGSAVGLGFDEAVWVPDLSGRPIVVGRGVVHACRLSDKAERGTVEMTNAAYCRVKSVLTNIQGIVELPFVSKEFKEDHGVQKVRMTWPPAGVGSDTGTIRNIVRRIFR